MPTPKEKSTVVEFYPDVPEAEIADLLRGAVDLHCHSGPSVMPRTLNHLEAIRDAEAVGMHAILFKDHYYSVTPVVELLKETVKDIRITMFSGVPLNNSTGGLNPYAVEHGLQLGARMVWMPTFSSANHIRQGHKHTILPTKSKMLAPTALTVVTDRGELKDEVKQILDLIAANDAVLSGGHLHISEMWPLFDEAKARGVTRMLVNHPTFVIDATVDDVRDLARMGVWIEHSFCMFINEPYSKFFTGQDLKALITAAGVDRTILGSDLGQINNPRPVASFRSVILLLLGLGYGKDDIRKLISLNACSLDGYCAASRSRGECLTMDLELQGKVALVTGSTSGIGEAAVRRLAREGASVVVHGRRAAEAERIVADITAAGGTAKAALGDLSNDAGAEQAASAALAAFGPIDILVNNAAVFRTDNWKTLDAADWIDQYDKNVASIVRIVKHILPPMRTRGWGRIIQMSSVGAMMPSEMTLNYGGTKAAVAVFSTGLAKVLAGTGITVNTVTPGPVLTPMLESWIRDIAKARAWNGDLPEWERQFATDVRPNPLGRVGRVEELADLITFLASPRAGFINGANIRVDGGAMPTV